MKDVGTGAPLRQTLLVTGFGSFPGARRNPAVEILRRLSRHRSRLARLGIDLRCIVLPVVFDAVEPALAAAIGTARPASILHLGLAGGRRAITIETRAVNRAGPLHPDASKRRPAQRLHPGAPQVLRATYPAERIRAALRRAGVDARLSIDAGDYVCNATLFRSLAGGLAPSIGFIHVPRATERRPLASNPVRRPTLDAMTEAILLAILTMVREGSVAGRPAVPSASARAADLV